MKKPFQFFHSVLSFYRDGFRSQTWGRPLIWLVLLKLFILFAILRVFFFRPALSGLSEEQMIEKVGKRLTGTPAAPRVTLNF